MSRTSTVAAVSSTSSTYHGNDRLNNDIYDPNGNTVVTTLPTVPLVLRKRSLTSTTSKFI